MDRSEIGKRHTIVIRLLEVGSGDRVVAQAEIDTEPITDVGDLQPGEDFPFPLAVPLHPAVIDRVSTESRYV